VTPKILAAAGGNLAVASTSSACADHHGAARKMDGEHADTQARRLDRARATVCGMSWNFRSRNTCPPPLKMSRTKAGPQAVNSSIPTLKRVARGRSACTSCRRGFAAVHVQSDDKRSAFGGFMTRRIVTDFGPFARTRTRPREVDGGAGGR